LGLRDLLVILTVLVGLPFILRRPYIGVMYWAWFGLMNPHRLTYGLAYNLPFAVLIFAATMLGLLFTRDERRWKAGPEVYALLALVIWMCMTTVFALDFYAARLQLDRVVKIQVMTFVALVLLNSKRHVEILVWIMALSIGFFAIKGGMFTLATGGNFRVWGPEGSYIEDNNALALATVMTIPLFFHLRAQTDRKWLRMALAAAMVLCAFSALGSHSRGALLAIASMTLFLWLHSRNKFSLGIVLAVVVPAVVLFMPSEWTERMHTINNYEQDGSAQGRLHTWTMLFRIANDRFFGGGFEPYTQEIFNRYMPEFPEVHAAHSIYFQFLGEHGWIGLILFALMWGFTWRASGQLLTATHARADLRWAHSLSSMIRVSLVGYFVGGAFLGLGYWDFPYYEIVLIVLMRDIVRRTPAAETVPAVELPPPTARINPYTRPAPTPIKPSVQITEQPVRRR